MRRFCPLLLLLVAGVAPVCAQDAQDILHRLFDAMEKNSEPAGRYLYTEDQTHFSYAKNGELKKEWTETSEIIFLEGDAYKKRIARNGQPLNPKEQSKEDKKLKQTAEERRKQRRNGLFQHNVTSGTLGDLVTIFDSRVIGEEELGGHKTWVIEAAPKANHTPVDEREKEALSFKKKLWIDQADYNMVRLIDTVIGDKIIVKPGTVIIYDFDRINNEAWLPTSRSQDYKAQFMKMVEHGRDEWQYSNFHKFDVQSTITADPIR